MALDFACSVVVFNFEHEWLRQKPKVQLRSPYDLFTKAIALHNCADSYEDRYTAGTHLLISLRHHQIGKRLALAGTQLKQQGWKLIQGAWPMQPCGVHSVVRAGSASVGLGRI